MSTTIYRDPQLAALADDIHDTLLARGVSVVPSFGELYSIVEGHIYDLRDRWGFMPNLSDPRQEHDARDDLLASLDDWHEDRSAA